ncbi:AAA family ATPase [Roseburia hominis]
MKTLYLIGGTMGVGKTTVCRSLQQRLHNSVFLDGDWCWDANPFQVTEETRHMVLDNICYLLNNFIHCSAYENIIFCWVMHQQCIIDHIVENLDIKECNVKIISLLCDEASLKERLKGDIDRGIRSADVIDRSIDRLPMYQTLDTIKIETSLKSVEDIAEEILRRQK